MTLWTLDTCGFDATNQNCQIFINDATGEETFVRRCPAHQTATPAQTHAENSRGSSNTLDELIQNAPTGMVDIGTDGTRSFKQGINVAWAWSGTAPNRVLNITVTGFSPTANQRNAIQAKLDSRFGAGNVTVTYG